MYKAVGNSKYTLSFNLQSNPVRHILEYPLFQIRKLRCK